MTQIGSDLRRATLGALTLALALTACGDPTPDAENAGQATAGTVDSSAVPAASAEEAGALVNPNQAAAADLTAIGLDSAQAAALVTGRPFESMSAVDEALAARMDSAAREDLYRRMFIPLDLNTATREEILLIPDIGPRMAHEFEEYRPYRGIEQFRREIGKYVDAQEVARLERYVTIR